MANKLYICDCAFCLSLTTNMSKEDNIFGAKVDYSKLSNNNLINQDYLSCKPKKKELVSKTAIRNNVSQKKLTRNTREVALLVS